MGLKPFDEVEELDSSSGSHSLGWETGWRLYEAYNELAAAAGGFEGKVEAPAIVVVGQQTDGKSALVEALMGFQFNHVGGGTKTRRPVELHLRYNPDCTEAPYCRLVSDSEPGVSIPMPLADIQAYIEAENMRLESDPCQFSDKEIVINIEYKYCPNLTIIDTPGLIIPAPGHKNRVLQSQAHAVEALVRTKMQNREYIILCLEDCSDWINATTRRVVMQIDPELSRTVLVSTKLDTKIPQFARASDVEVFLRPPDSVLDGCLLGDSPFFTSVPSGRVGSGHEAIFRSNEEFKKAVALREVEDVTLLEEKLGRSLSKEERSKIGVSNLRLFLEELLQKRYIESVPLIIPLLDKEHRSIIRKLREINQEISSLDEVKLKEKVRTFHDSFLTKLSLLLKGTVVAPPDKFGETLQDERINGGTFTGSDSFQLPNKMMPNAGMRLYGGAQYHRAMAEFRLVVGGMKCPPITREEIVNACGVEDIHDGTNYSRSACVIAVSKARETFEPFLHQALVHIEEAAPYISLFTQDISTRIHLPFEIFQKETENPWDANRWILSNLMVQHHLKDGEHLGGNEMFLKRIEAAFSNFAESTEHACRAKCMEDLESTTRYVTWSLHNKNRAGLRHFLDSFAGDHSTPVPVTRSNPTNNLSEKSNNSTVVDSSSSGQIQSVTETRLVDLLDSTLWNRKLAASSERLVCALVHQIFHGIKEHCLVSTELKFNCFLLMPVVDKLPALLKEDLESIFVDDLDSIFHFSQLKHSLGQRKREMEIELKRLQRLKEKFKDINEQLNSYSIKPKCASVVLTST